MTAAKKVRAQEVFVEPDARTNIVMKVNLQRDGAVYALHPRSRDRIAAAWPAVATAPMVFVGYDTRDDFEALHGPMWRQVIAMLSGVSYERLRELGPVVLWNVASGETREV